MMLTNRTNSRHQRPIRWAGILLLCIACSVVGSFVGAWWYTTFGPPNAQLGYEFEGMQEVAAGAAIGGFAGAFWGWIALGPDRPRAPTLGLVAIGGIAAGALVMTGLVYIGSWTNSDGPDAAAVIGVLGIPAGLALAVAIARAARRKVR
jgi:hypothetical protein